MRLIGVGRLGKDAEVREAGDTKVVNLAVAWNWGKKDEEGNRKSQWIDAAFFGDRAEKVAPYLKKGNQVMFVISDVHVELKEGENGTRAYMKGRVDTLDLIGGQNKGDDSGAKTPAKKEAPKKEAAKKKEEPIDDDDIPF